MKGRQILVKVSILKLMSLERSVTLTLRTESLRARGPVSTASRSQWFLTA